ITVLVDHGANIDAKDLRNQTPLMWAAARNNADAVKVLIAHGADVNARTPKKDFPASRPSVFDAAAPTGFTPLLFAVRAGSTGAARALLDAGANVNDTVS